jgi:hypothetical protein
MALRSDAARAHEYLRRSMDSTRQHQALMKARHGQRIGTMPVQPPRHPALRPLRRLLPITRKIARATRSHTLKPTASEHRTALRWQASGRPCSRELGGRLVCATRQLIPVEQALHRKQALTPILVAGHKGRRQMEELRVPSVTVIPTPVMKSLNQMFSRLATSTATLHRRTRNHILRHGHRMGSALQIRIDIATARLGTYQPASRAGVKRVST